MIILRPLSMLFKQLLHKLYVFVHCVLPENIWSKLTKSKKYINKANLYGHVFYAQFAQWTLNLPNSLHLFWLKITFLPSVSCWNSIPLLRPTHYATLSFLDAILALSKINTHIVSIQYQFCLCQYSLCHAFLAVPAVPLCLPLQVEHSRPRCVAVPLRGLVVIMVN